MPNENLPNNSAVATRGTDEDVSVVKEGFFDGPSVGNEGNETPKDTKNANGKNENPKDSGKKDEPNADTKALQELVKQQAKTIKSFEEQMKNLSANSQKQQEEENIPKDLYEAVGVDKDNFIFDFEEAISDPNSDSGRMMKAMNAMTFAPVLEKQKNEIISQVTQALNQQKAEKAISDFRNKTGLQDDKAFNDFQQFVENRNFTLEDAYKLFSLENGGRMPQVQQPNGGSLMNFLNSSQMQNNGGAFPINTNNVREAGNGGKAKLTLKDMIS